MSKAIGALIFVFWYLWAPNRVLSLQAILVSCKKFQRRRKNKNKWLAASFEIWIVLFIQLYIIIIIILNNVYTELYFRSRIDSNTIISFLAHH